MLYNVLAIVSCILSCLALIFSIVALIKVIASEKSTHSVQYMDPKHLVQDWATNEKEVENINKEFSEKFDMEDEVDVTII